MLYVHVHAYVWMHVTMESLNIFYIYKWIRKLSQCLYFDCQLIKVKL